VQGLFPVFPPRHDGLASLQRQHLNAIRLSVCLSIPRIGRPTPRPLVALSSCRGGDCEAPGCPRLIQHEINPNLFNRPRRPALSLSS
jgi:hypothetical protein